MCVDEYSYDMRALHTKDCSQEFGHTKGCMKSKYVDPEGNQIGILYPNVLCCNAVSDAIIQNSISNIITYIHHYYDITVR